MAQHTDNKAMTTLSKGSTGTSNSWHTCAKQAREHESEDSAAERRVDGPRRPSRKLRKKNFYCWITRATSFSRNPVALEAHCGRWRTRLRRRSGEARGRTASSVTIGVTVLCNTEMPQQPSPLLVTVPTRWKSSSKSKEHSVQVVHVITRTEADSHTNWTGGLRWEPRVGFLARIPLGFFRKRVATQ